MTLKPWKIVSFSGLFALAGLFIFLYSRLELPAVRGSYAVGQTIFRWVDTSRPEVLTEEPDDFREVAALVWYPAVPGTGERAGYFPNLSPVSQALMQSGEIAPWQVVALRFVRSDRMLHADPLKEGLRFPVIILSPGNGTNSEFYSSLAGEIASHGYIVIGINHPYDVAAAELSDGQVAAYDRQQWTLGREAHQAYIRERMKVRTADVLFVLDQLEELNTTGPLAGMIDLNSVAAAGHSLGGITAAEACKADPRFRACINFDGLQMGGPFSMEATAIPPQQPFLFLTKEAQLHPKVLQSFELTSKSYWVVVHGASHDSFTDGPLLKSSFWPGGHHAVDHSKATQEYTLAFLDHVLKGQPVALLSTALESDDVSVTVFPSH